MYIAIGTRPFITHSVYMLSEFNNCYERAHCIAYKRVLRYVKGTIDLKLVYKKDELQLKRYVDADASSTGSPSPSAGFSHVSTLCGNFKRRPFPTLSFKF